MRILIIITFLSILSSCGNSDENRIKATSITNDKSHETNEEIITELLGNYHGLQLQYFLKNEYGDDLMINGNRVPVPSSDYKFLIKENNVVTLQQINLVDNSRIYYDGQYKIILEDDDMVKIECLLTDGKYSKPVYILTIKKANKKGVCDNENEPQIEIKKID